MRNREVNSVTITDESGTVFVHLEKERKPQNNVVSLARDIRLDQKVIGKVSLELTSAYVDRDFFDDILKLLLALLAQVIFFS
jgi:hypothetical protein